MYAIHVILVYVDKVHQYLEEHLMRPFPHRTGLLNKHGPIRTGKHLRRRMSVKGAIKKTRSIAVERKQHLSH